MSPPQINNHTVYLLPLKDDGSPDLPGEPPYVYLAPPTHPAYSIRFQIDGMSSICREGSLWVNIPKKGERFDRKKFNEYKLNPSFNQSIKIDVPVHCAGAFEFYSSYTPLPPFTTAKTETPTPTRTQTYYIDVSPKLHVDNAPLPLDAISIISVLSKFMGKFPEDFNRHLHGISERGYNMVHFTPLMMRGDSNSPYSIYDQHTYDKAIFPKGEADVAELVHKMEHEYGLLSLTDVVWNHTANNSKFLEEHPEAGYNINTAPHLQPAYELDTAFLNYSSRLASLGLPTHLSSVGDLQRIMDGVDTHVLSAIKLWEFYVCDPDKDAAAAVAAWKEGKAKFDGDVPSNIGSWALKDMSDWVRKNCCPGTDRMGERFRRQLVPERGAALLSQMFGKYAYSTSGKTAYDSIHRILNEVNVDWYREYDADVTAIKDQVFNRTKYTRLEENGPKIGDITAQAPLIESYFTRLPKNETTAKHDSGSMALANNGWVWAADVMRDNAGPKSKVYLRRELIVWGDCVKLRYGSGPADSPYLWQWMTDYTQLMAKHFHGFRIDNCHSTPLHVASHMLDAARHVQPNLVIAAELFSGDERMDFLYCQKLGISFLIREAMQCWSTAEMSKLVHINCGRPIGSFEVDDISGAEKPVQQNGDLTNGTAPQGRELVHKIIPSKIHALLMDCTHDNETPVQRRDGRDTLPTSALVAMCASASGSVFGMDELYPQLIELVHETRPYTSPYSNLKPDESMRVGPTEGTGGIKRLMNQLHTIMGKDKYDETFVHHDGEYITVHRIHPKSRKGYYLIAHTAYPGCDNGNAGFGPQRLTGTKAKLLGAWNLECDQSQEAKQAAIKDKVLRGIPSKTKDLRGVNVESRGEDTVITVPPNFPPGSIAVFETWIPGAEHNEGLDKYLTSGALEAFKDCSLSDINAIMYRADSEERAMSGGADGVYSIPGIGNLVYCGLQGWWSVLRDVVAHNDLGHPICNHLREGQWALDYIVNRLDKLAQRQDGIYKGVAPPAEWLRTRFAAIRDVPSFLLPRCFALAIRTAKKAANERAIEQMNPIVQHGQTFIKSLAMVSCQVQGYMDNAKLWPEKLDPSLAAGLPHFAQDWARVWGRDTMIAMRGLLTCTGRFQEAKEHLLCFASLVKHGMIPNLLNSGKLPRYNSRDSVWFFLQNIQDYVAMAPQGSTFLQERVHRRFLPYDDTWFAWDDKRAYSQTSSIEDVIQECLQRHASGMHFREYNAGSELDSQMKSEGFNIDITPDWNTGIIYGGNEWNCGTWMDKMGDSTKAGNKGHPGTSRDGAPVEITGLLYSTLKWADNLKTAGKFKYDGVTASDGKLITYGAWAAKIRNSFEHCYYVPADSSQWSQYDVNPSIVNRKGIYKDVHRGKKEYRDYQLRPNFPIAMVVAPDLFDPAHALGALELADKYLLGPCGMATLDPGDMEYHPDYINSDDSDNYQTAHGRNYHQGPEWLWPTGFFLRALLMFDLKRRTTKEERVEAFQQVTQRLKGCKAMIRDSPWRGLTELTNHNGSYCGDSCPTQAWSAGCILDLYDDASKHGPDVPQ